VSLEAKILDSINHVLDLVCCGGLFHDDNH
jgi:hypothetical protein